MRTKRKIAKKVAKKTTRRIGKPVRLTITVAMKRAGAAVIDSATEMSAGDRAAAVYRAMASKMRK